MKFTHKIFSAIKTCDCLILGVYDSGALQQVGSYLDKSSAALVKRLIKQGDFQGQLAQTKMLHIADKTLSRILLVGLGDKADLSGNHFQLAIAAAMKILSNTPCKNAAIDVENIAVKTKDLHWKVMHTTSLTCNAIYRFNQFKHDTKQAKPALKELSFGQSSTKSSKTTQTAIKLGQAQGNGMALCKDLGNMPANACTPSYLATVARQLAKQFPKIKTTILSEAQMKKLGMGSLLSVSAGSIQPAKFILMHYQGTKATEKPFALVGKGITFDSGGISIKPSAMMDEMKYDMGGAASVFGTLRAVAQMKLPINLICAVAAAENMPGGNATKPGDIVKSLSGKTIEILNTDAEGRLVLCDALTYIQRYKPQAVINMATLTGAIVVALGNKISGLFSNNQQLTDDLLKASKISEDQTWHMPIEDSYGEQMQSNFADLANCGNRWGGSITAAYFLSQFTKDITWAHIDIAGVAWTGGKDKGATGRPVPLLLQYLLNKCDHDK